MIIIGRRDRIDLPDLKLKNIKSKIDTGAYGCAIHCHRIELVKKHGNEYLSVQFLDPHFKEYNDTKVKFHDFSMKRVRSSSGKEELRYTVMLQMKLFGKSHAVEFSLTQRSLMKHPVLIGRKFLAYRFLVDVTQKDLSYQQKRSKK